MKEEYLVSPRTNGANPFKIFEACGSVDQHKLETILRQLTYDQFLNTAYWFGVSHTAKSRAGMRCQVCNSPNQISVHHRTYDTHGKEHCYMMDLVVLCRNCHGLFHGHQEEEYVPERIKQPKTKRPRISVEVDNSESLMPNGDPIVLTSELVQRCRTSKWGFTNATLIALNINKSEMQSGWVRRLNGRSVPRSKYLEALKGRYIYGVRM